MGGQEVCQTGRFRGAAGVRVGEGFRMGEVLCDAVFCLFCELSFASPSSCLGVNLSRACSEAAIAALAMAGTRCRPILCDRERLRYS